MMKLLQDRIDPEELLKRYFAQVYYVDIAQGRIQEIITSAQNEAPSQDYEVWLNTQLADLYPFDRQQIYARLQLVEICSYLKQYEALALPIPAQSQEYHLHITFYDQTHSALLFLVHFPETSLHVLTIQKQKQKLEQQCQFLVDHLVESFLQTNVRTGECRLLHADNDMQPHMTFVEQVKWWADNLIVPEERERYLQEYDFTNLMHTLHEHNGQFASTYNGIINQSRRCISVVSALYRDTAGEQEEYVLSYAQDITTQVEQLNRNKKLIQFSQQLLNMSQTEAVTGLYNRAAGEKYIDEFLQQSSCTGTMLLIDLDKFKNVNDSFGHAIGDKVLQYLASAMKETFRADDILCRWGGDEFLAFLGNVCDENLIIMRIKQLQDKMQCCLVAGKTLSVTLSIGVATTKTSMQRELLFQQCDKALYAVKRQGRNNYQIYTI